MEIKSLNKLTEEQKNHIYEVNELHTQCVGSLKKMGTGITTQAEKNGTRQ